MKYAAFATLALALVVTLLLKTSSPTPAGAIVRDGDPARRHEAALDSSALEEQGTGTTEPTRNTVDSDNDEEPAPSQGATAADAAFTVEAAQRATRDIVTPLPDAYLEDFERIATKWPKGTQGKDPQTMPLLESSSFNPEGLKLSAVDLNELRSMAGRYNADLEALAGLAHDLASEAMAEYFDTMKGAGWVRQENVDPNGAAATTYGRWNRALVVSHRGYQRRIEFDSADFPQLELHFESMASLRRERDDAIRAWIASRGY